MNKTKNFWDYNICSPNEILADKDLTKLIKKVFIELLNAYNIDKELSDYFISKLFDVKTYQDVAIFEKNVKASFNNLINKEMKDFSYRKRAELICKQIQEFILGNKIADYGCGDGLVSYYLSEKWNKDFEYELFDIKDYRHEKVLLNFDLLNDKQILKYNDVYNTVLLLTVLHHSMNPILVLENAIKLSKKRIIVIESVFDVPNDSIYSPIKGLSTETQIKYAIFWDWFYNRVIHDDILVPYNFQPSFKWEETFNNYRLKIIHKQNLGIDQKIVPEHHFLFILDKV